MLAETSRGPGSIPPQHSDGAVEGALPLTPLGDKGRVQHTVGVQEMLLAGSQLSQEMNRAVIHQLRAQTL